MRCKYDSFKTSQRSACELQHVVSWTKSNRSKYTSDWDIVHNKGAKSSMVKVFEHDSSFLLVSPEPFSAFLILLEKYR